MVKVWILILLIALIPLEAQASCVEAIRTALGRLKGSPVEFDPGSFAESKARYSQLIQFKSQIRDLPSTPLEKVALVEAMRQSTYKDRDLAVALSEATPKARQSLLKKLSKLDFDRGLTEEETTTALRTLSEFIYGKPLSYLALHHPLTRGNWWGDAEQALLLKKVDSDLRTMPIIEALRSHGLIRDPKNFEKASLNLIKSGRWLDQTVTMITSAYALIESHTLPPLRHELLKRKQFPLWLRQKIIMRGPEACREDLREYFGKIPRVDLFTDWAIKVYVVGLEAAMAKSAVSYALTRYSDHQKHKEPVRLQVDEAMFNSFKEQYRQNTGSEPSEEQIALFKQMASQPIQ